MTPSFTQIALTLITIISDEDTLEEVWSLLDKTKLDEQNPKKVG